MQAKRLFAGQVWQLMKKRKVTKAELARRLNTSQKAIDRLLNDTGNITLATMCAAAQALDARAVVIVEWRKGS